jgi:hypothetical protein
VLLVLAACGTPPEAPSGPETPPIPPPAEACQPVRCEDLSATCGTVSDGCGGTLQCGTCGIGQTCGGGGQANACGTPDYGVTYACSRDGVCFLNPRPVSHDFKDVWGRSVEDFWAVGNAGFIVHGGHSELSVLPSEAELSGIWGSAAEDVWAVGSQILHFDGRRWSEVLRPERFLLDVYGTGAGNVWAVGHEGVAYAWNGTRWERQSLGTSADLYGVWAHGEVVWAVGTASTIRVRDAQGWSELTPPLPGLTFTGVWGTGPEDVWVTSEKSGEALFHWDGRAWSSVSLPISDLYGISGKSSTDILVVGEKGSAQYDGDRWTVAVNSTPSRLLGAWHAADGKLLVGVAGQVHRSARGHPWHSLDQGGRADLVSLSVPEEDRWWFANGTSLFADLKIDMPQPGPSNALVAMGYRRLWAVGDFGRVDLHSWGPHGNGTNFFYLPQTFHFRGIFPLRDDPSAHAWLVGADSVTGQGVLVQLQAYNTWTRYPLEAPGALNAVHGTQADDVWAVGDGVIAHWDGKAWTETRAPGMPAFLAVKAMERDLAWALSAKSLWRWDGTNWWPLHPPAGLEQPELRAFFTDRRDELYVTGERGLLLRYDVPRNAWHRIETGTRKGLRAISGGPLRLIIAGEDGTVLQLHR